MASGSSVTIDGGTNMTQVVAGDIIDDADFNNSRTNVNTLLTTAADITLGAGSMPATNTIFGYGQGGVGVNAASAGGNIFADNATGGFKRLQDDVQALCAFLGQTVRTNVGSDVTSSTIIDDTTWSNTMLNVKDCWDNRFAPASRTSATGDSASRTSAWTTSLQVEKTFTWANEGLCRAYFNGGGRVGMSASRTSGTSSTQNTDWTNLFSAMGDVFIDYQTAGGSSGTNANLGFYELSTSYQLLWTKLGSGAYASNYFKLFGKVNSTTNPTVVTLKAELSDPYTAAAAAANDSAVGPDGVPSTADDADGYTDSIDGTLTINGRTHTPDASGSGFSFTAPTVASGSISGS
tara:strand:- start:127 stop:1173 length:1047 start_codon:yes stop_codon:yes gene_type:complete